MSGRSDTPRLAGLDVQELRARVAVGAPAGRLGDLPPRVRRATELAQAVGAPIGPAVTAALAATDDVRARGRAVQVATAQARAVVVALALLPVAGVPGLGAILRLPLLAFYGTPLGHTVLAVSTALAVAGLLLARRLTRRAFLPGPGASDDEAYDLTATALTAGMSPGQALREAARRLDGPGAELARVALALDLGAPASDQGRFGPLVAALSSASRWGAPAAPALRRLADDLRADERARVAAAAQRLPALLTFPTVLFLLPASLLLVGAPVLASGLTAVVDGA